MKVLDLKIALPRASLHCPNKPDLNCWGWEFNEEIARESIPKTEAAAAECFPQAQAIGFIGFSSGGYLVNQLFQRHLVKKVYPRVRWNVSIGSSLGRWIDSDAISGFLDSRPLVLLVGKQDHSNYDPKDGYFHFLKSHGAQVSLQLFDGGHDVPDEPFITAVKSVQLE